MPFSKVGHGNGNGHGHGIRHNSMAYEEDRMDAKTYAARPPKKEKAIDPDNPFAQALMGLKDKT